MVNLELNKLISEYVDLQKKEDELSSQKESLKEKIIEIMGDEKSYDNGYAKATISLAEGFKYNDKIGAMNQIKAHGYERFISEEIDTKKLNSFLRDNQDNPLSESLLNGNYISKSITTKLTIKEK